MKKELKKYLIIGIAASVVTVAGEMTGGYAPSSDTVSIGARAAADWIEKTLGAELSGVMLSLLTSFENLTVCQIGMGAFIGAIGIALQYLANLGLYRSFDNKDKLSASLFYYSNTGYTIVGSMVHVMCSAVTYVYKTNASSENCWKVVGEFSLWFLAPVTVLFLASYAVFLVTLFIQFLNGHTVFPRWCCILNPVVGKGLIGGIARALPSSALTHAISYANMGLSSVIIFTVLLICLNKSEKTEELK